LLKSIGVTGEESENLSNFLTIFSLFLNYFQLFLSPSNHDVSTGTSTLELMHHTSNSGLHGFPLKEHIKSVLTSESHLSAAGHDIVWCSTWRIIAYLGSPGKL
jgi:hypothetical protein